MSGRIFGHFRKWYIILASVSGVNWVWPLQLDISRRSSLMPVIIRLECPMPWLNRMELNDAVDRSFYSSLFLVMNYQSSRLSQYSAFPSHTFFDQSDWSECACITMHTHIRLRSIFAALASLIHILSFQLRRSIVKKNQSSPLKFLSNIFHSMGPNWMPATCDAYAEQNARAHTLSKHSFYSCIYIWKTCEAMLMFSPSVFLCVLHVAGIYHTIVRPSALYLYVSDPSLPRLSLSTANTLYLALQAYH